MRKEILALLGDAQKDGGLAIVFITHDLAVVRAISHRVLVMYMGRLVELADCASLYSRAQHPYTKALLDAVPTPDPAAAGGTVSLSGEVPSILSPPSGCAFHPRCRFAKDICRAELPLPRIVNGSIVACHRAEEISL